MLAGLIHSAMTHSGRRSRKFSADRCFKARLSIEHLETRLAPALYLVTNSNDAGPGSLRQAIINSNVVVPNWDEIRIEPQVTTAISLQSELPTIAGDVDINGPPGMGATATITRGVVDPFRILTMAPNGIIVTLRRLEITGGRAVDGGGIYAMAHLIMEDCIVTENAATNNGGGIFHTLAPLRLTRTEVGLNSAGNSGGGIYSVGQGSLQTCEIEYYEIYYNTAGNNGGGIYYDADGIVSVYNSFVYGNEAVNNGGGLYSANAAALGVGGDDKAFHAFWWNRAANGMGGAIYAGCVVLSLYVDTDISANMAADPTTVGMYAKIWPYCSLYIGPDVGDTYRIVYK